MDISKLVQLAKTKTKIVFTCGFVLTFLLGYVVGREHVKYQVRSGINEAVSEFQEEIGNIFGGGEPEPAQKTPSRRNTEQPIGITLTNKKLVKGDWQTKINLYFDLMNKIDKNIRAFTGQVVFLDLFDKEIMRINLTYEDGIPVGETRAWEGGIDYNQFSDEDQRLADISMEDVTVRLEVHEVLFADGTREEY